MAAWQARGGQPHLHVVDDVDPGAAQIPKVALSIVVQVGAWSQREVRVQQDGQLFCTLEAKRCVGRAALMCGTHDATERTCGQPDGAAAAACKVVQDDATNLSALAHARAVADEEASTCQHPSGLTDSDVLECCNCVGSLQMRMRPSADS